MPPEPPPAPDPSVVDEQESLPTTVPEGATSSAEEHIGTSTDPSTSKYWDEDQPAKRRRKANPKFVQHAERFVPHAMSTRR
jgi:hypothetical protein